MQELYTTRRDTCQKISYIKEQTLVVIVNKNN